MKKPHPQQGRLFGDGAMKAAANGKPAPAPVAAIANFLAESLKRKRRAARYVPPGPDDLDDICRNNHGGEEHSEAANRKVTPRKRAQHVKIIEYMRKYTPEGTIADAIMDQLGFKSQTMYPRFSELKKDGTLVKVLDADGKWLRMNTRDGNGAGMWKLKEGL
jgi:DNA invertase Pin-like site-specific DNA recombinase